MKLSVEQISKLLSETRIASPEDGYWQDFLKDFHHARQLSAARKSTFASWSELASAWFAQMNFSRFAYGAGLAYAAATIGFMLTPRPAEIERIPASRIHHQVFPAPSLEQLEQLDVNSSSRGNAGEQVF